MQYGREPLAKTAAMLTADGEPGWICSTHPEHFHRGDDRPAAEPVGIDAAHATWDDDGGTRDERKVLAFAVASRK